MTLTRLGTYIWPLWLLFTCYTTQAQVFAADVASSEWAVSTSPVCSLSHSIAGYGRAVFVQNPSGAAIFYIEPQGKVIFPVGEVNIETMPPAWRSNVIPLHLGETSAVTGTKPISLDSTQLHLVLEHLAKGTNVVFSSQLPSKKNIATEDKSSSAPLANGMVMRLVLEAKNFTVAYKSFQVCFSDTAPEKPTSATGVAQEQRSPSNGLSVDGNAWRDSKLHGSTLSSRSGNAETTKTFAADIKTADWILAATPFMCSLTHDIPNFGKAVLMHKAGNNELFYLEPQSSVIFPVGDTRFETAPPVWRGDQIPMQLGRVSAVIGKQPVTLIADQVTLLLAQLTAGTRIMFVSQNAGVAQNNTEVGSTIFRVYVDPKNFTAVHKKFQQCVNDLIPYTFSQIARSTFNYAENDVELSATIKQELAKIVRYVKADEKVLRILIDAHADNSGTPEERELRSKQQAELISAYLTQQGVPAAKIAARWHSDTLAVGDNKTPAGRAKNRRVTVRLEDEAMQKEIANKIAQEKASENNEEKDRLAKKSESKTSESKSSDTVASKGNKEVTTSQSAKAAKPVEKAETESAHSSQSSIQGKITPEQINKMVEGLELINKK